MDKNENILQGFRKAGQLESEGEITIPSAQALKSLASFQHPFEGAWAVKVVQAVIAPGNA